MSLSVEKLKELETFFDELVNDKEFPPLSDRPKNVLTAIRELIAIKEAEPVAWLVHAEYEFVDRQPQIIGGLPRTPLIRKPE